VIAGWLMRTQVSKNLKARAMSNCNWLSKYSQDTENNTCLDVQCL
jgi:hypothetical protein